MTLIARKLHLNKARVKRIFLFLALCTTGFGFILVIDLWLAKTNYSLTVLYQTASAAICLQSKAPSCHTNSTSAVTGRLGTTGMVVSEQREASQVGIDILNAGGNAIDAAVAVGYALAVTYPCCGNLGGGGFMLIRFADGRTRFLDFREMAPGAATQTMYLDAKGQVISNLSTNGYLAVGVPGTVKGLDYALTTYGTRNRQQVMAPAITLAEQGFTLQAADVALLKGFTKTFKAQPNVASIFLKNGEPYQSGDRFVQSNLARSLLLIADQGANAFYQGAIANELVTASQQGRGILTKADLAKYQVRDTVPLQCRYHNYQVLTSPPPGGGATLCEMLNILEGYPQSNDLSQTLHRRLSAMLFAYADRNTKLGDPAFVQNPLDQLLSKSYAASIRQKIPTDRALDPNQVYRTPDTTKGNHTTHYTIVDRQGNIVSVTYTLNRPFGAGVIAGQTGFFLNNEMDDFTVKPGVANSYGLVQGNANAIAPLKRPLSSMSPTILLKDNQPVLATGSPGGSTIPTTVLQVILNREANLPPQQWVHAPRIHYQGLPNVVITEPYALPNPVFQQLWRMGYRVMPFPNWGAAESITIDPTTQTIYGLHDSRKPTGAAITQK